jgi:hypothetical protein
MNAHQTAAFIGLRKMAASFRRDAEATILPHYKILMFKAADDLDLCATELEAEQNLHS